MPLGDKLEWEKTEGRQIAFDGTYTVRVPLRDDPRDEKLWTEAFNHVAQEAQTCKARITGCWVTLSGVEPGQEAEIRTEVEGLVWKATAVVESEQQRLTALVSAFRAIPG